MATKKSAKKTAAKKAARQPAQKKSQEEVRVVHVYPDVEIVEGSQFTEGVPSRMNVSISYKMTTKAYENMTFQSSISLDLKKGADVALASEQAYNFVAKEVIDRVNGTRAKMKGNQSGDADV